MARLANVLAHCHELVAAFTDEAADALGLTVSVVTFGRSRSLSYIANDSHQASLGASVVGPRPWVNRRTDLVSEAGTLAGRMARALVLNATYEPLSIVSARRAVVLVLREKAELVEHGNGAFRSEAVALPMPSVIRLRTFVKVPYARRVPLNRRAVFARDAGRCQYCGKGAENLDHVVPRSRGGAHAWENVVACCRRCNTRKGSRALEDAGLKLLRRPEAPRRHGWVLVSLGGAPDPAWKRYLFDGY
jgi:5-methylcytosine-specific restriction endonuclease McrA